MQPSRRQLLLALRDPVRLWLARTGLLAVIAFALAILVLHISVYPFEPIHMSEFAHSPWAWIWTAASAALAVASLVVAWAAAPVLPRDGRSLPGVLMLGLASFTLLLVAVIPVDAAGTTVAGQVHNDAAWATFLALAASMLLLGGAFRRSPFWVTLSPASLWLGRLAAALGVAYIWLDASNQGAAGLVQRAAVAVGLAWITLLALRLQELEAWAGRRLKKRQEKTGRSGPQRT